MQTKEIVPGAIFVSYNIAESAASMSLPLEAIPGRAGMTPGISLHYNGENHFDHGLGVGFSLSASSSSTRRRKTMAIDGSIEAPQFNDLDAFAIEGKPLVGVSQSAEQIEYRTFPDSQVKVVYDNNSDSFEAFFSDGSRILYIGRRMANTGEPHAWVAEERRDPRGNKILFDWCLAEDDEYAAEFALTSIRYSASEFLWAACQPKEAASTACFGVYPMKNGRFLTLDYLRRKEMAERCSLIRTQMDCLMPFSTLLLRIACPQ